MEIYQPQEDSLLLKKYVKEYSKGIVLDIGTGSGIQAQEAAKNKKVVKVYALDINREAIEHCKYNIFNKKIIFLYSNLFSVFRNNPRKYQGLKFDTIIFNPPYLPKEERDKDIALDGGKQGHELIQKFFYEAQDYLKPKTKILLVFSSLTGKDRIEKIIRKYRMSFKELEKKHIFFEDIYLYLIEKD